MVSKNSLEIIGKFKINDFNFSEHTTYRLGGKADYAYAPKTPGGAVAVYDYFKENKIPFVILGNGSNVLVSDKGYRGGVICTYCLSGIRQTGENKLYCRAGTKVGTLMKYCADNCLGGLEYLAGIPATIGGIVYMNGGAGGKYIADNVLKVKLYDGKVHNFSNKYCNFAYKYSTMQDINALILGVELAVYPLNGQIVKDNIKNALLKRSGLPVGASCGCVFKNADGCSAGKIIDEAGLKGLSFGGAEVSEKHANFIISTSSSSYDVLTLIKELKRLVLERTGVALEEEVVYIGDF